MEYGKLIVSQFISYTTSNQDILDFASYTIGDKTILIGGRISINETLVINNSELQKLINNDGEIRRLKDSLNITNTESKQQIEEQIEEKIIERTYNIVEKYYIENEKFLEHKPLSEFMEPILESYKYKNGKKDDYLIKNGLEPAIIVENARRMIFGEIDKTTPRIPYLQRYIFSEGKVSSYKKEKSDFGVAIYGDDYHVSGVLVQQDKSLQDVAYLFDSSGELHQIKAADEEIFKIKVSKISELRNGKAISLNPYGNKFQSDDSSVCGFWSSCFIVEASKYNNMQDFTKTVTHNSENIILVKPDFLANVAANVIKSVHPECIVDEKPNDLEIENYEKLGDFYIKKDCKELVKEDVDLERLKECTEAFKKKTNPLNQCAIVGTKATEFTSIKREELTAVINE